MPRSIRFFLGGLLVIVSGALLFHHLSQAPPPTAAPPPASVPTGKGKAGDHFDRFRIEKMASRQYDGSRLLFDVTADRVVHQKRQADLFHYENLKVIRLRNVHIEVYPESLAIARDSSNETLPTTLAALFGLDDLDSIAGDTARYLQTAGGDEEEIPEVRDFLSGALAEPLSMIFHLASGKTLTLSAARAKINTQIDYLLLEGQVELVTVDGTLLTAPLAVWSSRDGGLYLPAVAYVFNRATARGPAFFRIGTDGAVTREAVVPTVHYVDVIEAKEAELRRRLTDDAPLLLKAMLGITDLQPKQRKKR